MFSAYNLHFRVGVYIYYVRIIVNIAMYLYKIFNTFSRCLFLARGALRAPTPIKVAIRRLQKLSVLFAYNYYFFSCSFILYLGVVVPISVYFLKLMGIPLVFNLLGLRPYQ